jgi:hypothetical protein
MIFSIFFSKLLIKDNLRFLYINIFLFSLSATMSSIPLRPLAAHRSASAAEEEPNEPQNEQAQQGLEGEDLESYQDLSGDKTATHQQAPQEVVNSEDQQNQSTNQCTGNQPSQRPDENLGGQQSPPSLQDLRDQPNPPNLNMASRTNIWFDRANEACLFLAFSTTVGAHIAIVVKRNEEKIHNAILNCKGNKIHYVVFAVISVTWFGVTYKLIKSIWYPSTLSTNTRGRDICLGFKVNSIILNVISCCMDVMVFMHLALFVFFGRIPE